MLHGQWRTYNTCVVFYVYYMCRTDVLHSVLIETLKLLYNALVQPHFDYSDIVYGSTSITNRDRLQKQEPQATYYPITSLTNSSLIYELLLCIS